LLADTERSERKRAKKSESDDQGGGKAEVLGVGEPAEAPLHPVGVVRAPVGGQQACDFLTGRSPLLAHLLLRWRLHEKKKKRIINVKCSKVCKYINNNKYK
jgi:hypothetical protein